MKVKYIGGVPIRIAGKLVSQDAVVEFDDEITESLLNTTVWVEAKDKEIKKDEEGEI